MTQLIKSIPEQGQLVQVRNRKYAVVEVIKGHAKPGSITDLEGDSLVRLASVEDDGFGEEISVIWEIEPGASIFDRGTLPQPEGFDDPGDFDAFMNAVRWGVIASERSRDLQAPFRSSVDLESYQLEPLVRALQMPRVNLLIADDVGLGKTIESGLIAYELLLRHKARRMLIVCPASLQVQWKDQMRDRFGLEFLIVNSDLMKELRRTRGLQVNPWSHFPRLITSIDYLKRERPMRMFREVLPGPGEDVFPRRFDLLIVDEAHNVAPPGTGKYATDSMRTRAIKTIAPHFEHRLFLTATPHNGYPESFSALLELIDDQRFARGIEIDQKLVRAVMVRRLKSEIVDDDSGKKKFPPRELIPVEIEYDSLEKEAHSLLTEYSKLRREAGDPASRTAVEFVLKLLKKRLFSSPVAFGNTLQKHIDSFNRPWLKAKTKRKAPEKSILQRHIERMDEDFDNDEELEESTAEAMETAARYQAELAEAEQKILKKLTDYANSYLGKADSKAQKLIDWIQQTLFTDGKWNDRRVLIFTEYRDTQKWLLDLFAQAGFLDDDRTLELHGGVPGDEREKIKAAFQANPEQAKVRILLATDSASEGIDLQNFCSRLIHYEIPWNPNRMEQRNGRLDRHGQKADKVEIFHFVGSGYDRSDSLEFNPGQLEADLEFLYRTAKKIENIREDLGKVGPVLADRVSKAMLGYSANLNTDSVQKESATHKLLKWERDLTSQIQEYRNAANESKKNLNIYPEQMKSVAELGLQLASKPALIPVEKSNGTLYRIDENGMTGSWSRVLDGLRHPHTGQVRPVTFDQNLAKGRDDVVHVHLNHPLMSLSANLLRAQIWSPLDDRKLHRFTVRSVRDGDVDHYSVLLTSRFLVLGKDQRRLLEELIYAGGEIEKGKFKAIKTQQKLQELAKLDSKDEASKKSKDLIVELWSEIQSGLDKALKARVKERSENVQSILEKQRDSEISDITAILTELKDRIENELNKEEDPQYLLTFNDLEQSQYKNDREHLKRRLARIPEEIRQETEKIAARYSDIQVREFPVSITVLVPESRQ